MLFNILYNIIIMPLEILVSFTYEIVHMIVHNVGISIIAVSLVLQTILLPLYKRADQLQDEELAKQKRMEKWVKHIRKTFKGDERMMMLSTYYRQQNYKVYQSLNGSLSLLLQVPFFMAAYNYLSTLPALKGRSFGAIADLSVPDQLITIGAISINLLPILMTGVNLISGAIYSKKRSLRDKVQIYVLALIFLVLLYKSPSGLVLYWLMNNIYSLGKNAVMNDFCGIKSLFMRWIQHFKASQEKKKQNTPAKEVNEKNTIEYYIKNIQLQKHDYWWFAAFFTILLGALVPLSITASSPLEFTNSEYGPFTLIILTFSTYVGIFFLWGGIVYHQLSEKMKQISLLLLCMCFGIAMINYFIFGIYSNDLSPLLLSANNNDITRVAFNSSIICLLIIVVLLLYFRFKRFTQYIIQATVICIFILCLSNTYKIIRETKDFDRSSLDSVQSITPIIPLSKNGSNVVVIMLDRAMGCYVPYIFEERPEVKEAFSGFSYYPNTISFSENTAYCSPSLFGGYEYTPIEINHRDTEKLEDKQNEALRVLPNIFNKENYQVTICDPPYAGYDWVPDLSIYNQDENVSAYITKGKYSAYLNNNIDQLKQDYYKIQKHNFNYFPIIKILPLATQLTFNENGCTFLRRLHILESTFTESYSVLTILPELTKIEEDGNNLLLFQNSSTHEPTYLELPDYDYIPNTGYISFQSVYQEQPKVTVDGKTLDFADDDQLRHYHVNVGSFMQLANWLNYLKDKGVYDNTRIIIVSDHGRGLKQFEDMMISDELDIQSYNAVLLVKDFYSTEFSISDEFMTIADVPTLATAGVIDSPTNPFTGKAINSDEKNNHPQTIINLGNDVVIPDHSGATKFDLDQYPHYTVHDNIFDFSNWEKVAK